MVLGGCTPKRWCEGEGEEEEGNLNSSHPINRLQPVKGHQPQLCLCIPAGSQEAFSQGFGITWHIWTATDTGGWMSVSPTEARRRFWPYIKF